MVISLIIGLMLVDDFEDGLVMLSLLNKFDVDDKVV